MSQTDAAYLEQLKTWRDNLLTALATPETTSAFGGMPDNNGTNSLGRMGGRAQLLRELETVEQRIAETEDPLFIESRGFT